MSGTVLRSHPGEGASAPAPGWLTFCGHCPALLGAPPRSSCPSGALSPPPRAPLRGHGKIPTQHCQKPDSVSPPPCPPSLPEVLACSPTPGRRLCVCLLRVPQPSEDARAHSSHTCAPAHTHTLPNTLPALRSLAPPQPHPTASLLPLLMQGRAGPPHTTSPAEPSPSLGASPGHTWALASDSPSHPHAANPHPPGQCPRPRHGCTGASQLPPSD